MALFTKKEFADATGQTTKSLSVYAGRKKVVVKVDGMIDTNDPVNKAFIASHGWKKPEKANVYTDIATEEKKKAATVTIALKRAADSSINDTDSEDEDDLDGIDQPMVSDRKYKHHLAQKTKLSAEAEQIKIDKMNGVVVPSAMIEPLFMQHNQSILMEFKNMMDKELRAIAKEHDLTVDEVAIIKGRWIEGLNSAVREAAAVTIKAVRGIVNEFSVKRSVGQKS